MVWELVAFTLLWLFACCFFVVVVAFDGLGFDAVWLGLIGLWFVI